HGRAMPIAGQRLVGWLALCRGSRRPVSRPRRPCSKNAQAAPLLAAGGNEGLLVGGSMPPAKGRLWVYNGSMVLRRTPHAVYDTLYHLVWSPKYRRDVLQGEVQQRVQELFADIAEQYDIAIEEMETSPDHDHIFCSFPPRYSIAQVVTRFKSLS